MTSERSDVRVSEKVGMVGKSLSFIAFFMIISFCFALPGISHAAKNGSIKGRLLDAKTGEPLLGLSVYLENTTFGAVSDIDGNYLIKKISPGIYTLIVSGIGYERVEIPGFVVVEGETSTLDLSIREEMLKMDSVVVKGRVLKNTEATTLKIRQKAEYVGDAISSEQMSRSGSSDAASAMKKVVGVSVVGGKNIYIRGLGDRYANTSLNGNQLPSSDPDKQVVDLDIFPVGLLDNIIVQKTFTPDKPGNFSGGNVNLTTKDLPDGRTLKFSTSATYNSNTTDKNMLTYAGGSKDWLGYDDGKRAYADILDDGQGIPSPITASRDKEQAKRLNEIAESFNPQMQPTTRKGPLNQGYSLAFGDLWQFFDKPLGVQASLTYNQSYSNYNNGQVGVYHLGSGGATELLKQLRVDDSKGSYKVLWGGLLSASFHPHTNHKLQIDYIYNHSGESTARLLSGEYPEQLGEPLTNRYSIWRTRVLEYTERSLRSLQFKGEHGIKLIRPVRVTWQWSLSNTTQDEPDRRFFSDNTNYRLNSETGEWEQTDVEIQTASYPGPTRSYWNLDEKNHEGKVDLIIPLKSGSLSAGKFKVGLASLNKDRTFRERIFRYKVGGIQYGNRYDGNPDDFMSDNNLGIVESEYDPDSRFIPIGNSLSELPPGNYDGQQDVFAWYGMLDIPITNRLQFIGGFRRESTKMSITDNPTTSEEANVITSIDDADWLPAINLRYRLSGRMNLRMAATRTLARPNLREMAPFASQEYTGGYIFEGNSNLTYTKINNYDIRWEWFNRPGEVIAVSAFYKRLKNPIEVVVVDPNGDTRPENVTRGKVIGAEFEWRKSLDLLHSSLSYFKLGGNLTLVHAEVDINEFELLSFKAAYGPDVSTTRDLYGQSPYIVNIDLTYQNPNSEFNASLLYNIFGPRYMLNALDATPDVYEQPEHLVDFTLSAPIWSGVNFKFSAKNILNAKTRWTHEYLGKEYVHSEHSRGRSFTFGMSYSL